MRSIDDIRKIRGDPTISSWIDVQQVCLNGHQITDCVVDNPEDTKSFCPKCGSQTIIECPGCGNPILGHKHYSSGFTPSKKSIPTHCENCGRPFPWSVEEDEEKTDTPWDLFHPEIVKVSKKLFEDGHYAESVEAAYKVIENRVRGIYKSCMGNELNGVSLMRQAFKYDSSKAPHLNPVIALTDLSTQLERDIQEGYMQIFAGAMQGIRNPKAHYIIKISDKRALQFLHLASLLMEKLDDAHRVGAGN